jgi:RNA polymerase sigma-70 factor (ECF subfamily)
MRGFLTAALFALRGRSDEEAMWRVKTNDDHQAFTSLVGKWERPIYRLCTRLTGDAARGEELKQETFLKLFQSRKNYEPSARFSTFLWHIALNLCHDEFRREERRRQLLANSSTAIADADDERPEPASEAPGPDAAVAGLEESELVRQAVLRLPEVYRTVIVLRHYENLKLGQIAEALGIPEGTVNSRMAQALTRLSRALEPKLRQVALKPATARIPALMNVKKSTTL